jgi:hypothetical protein
VQLLLKHYAKIYKKEFILKLCNLQSSEGLNCKISLDCDGLSADNGVCPVQPIGPMRGFSFLFVLSTGLGSVQPPAQGVARA